LSGKDFFPLKNTSDCFFRKALAASMNIPKFCAEIAVPRFLLLSMGSINTNAVSNFFVGFPIICPCEKFAAASKIL